ncbi:MAG: hypothetical protein IJ662_00300 [Clostridia bacterium]|nr:hypothetical protein [Clostridia bacterium]
MTPTVKKASPTPTPTPKPTYSAWRSNGDGTHSRDLLQGKTVLDTETKECTLTPTAEYPQGQCSVCGYVAPSLLSVNGATLTYVPEGVYNNGFERISGGTVEVHYVYDGIESGPNSYDERLTVTMTLYRDGAAIGDYILPYEGYLFREEIEFPVPGAYSAVVTVSDGTESQSVTSNTVVIEGLKLNGATLYYQPYGVFDNGGNYLGQGTVEVDYAYNGYESSEFGSQFADTLIFAMTLYRDGAVIANYGSVFEGYLFNEGIEFPGPGAYYAIVGIKDGDDVQFVQTNVLRVLGDGALQTILDYEKQDTYAPGDALTFTWTVTNVSDVTLTYEDAMAWGEPGCPDSLAPGQSFSWSYPYTLRSGDGVDYSAAEREAFGLPGEGGLYFIIGSEVSYRNPDTDEIVSTGRYAFLPMEEGPAAVPYVPKPPVEIPNAPDVDVTLEIRNEGLNLTNVHVGDWVPVCATVTNTGAVPLVFMSFEGIESETEMAFSPALEPGQSETVWGWHEVTEEELELGHYTDPEEGFFTEERQETSVLWLTGTVHYLYVNLDDRNELTFWDAEDDAALYVRLTDARSMVDDIVLQCEYDSRAYAVGEEMTLHWTVTNVGPDTLHKVVDDPNNQTVPGLPDTLAPGESYAWTETAFISLDAYVDGLQRDSDGNRIFDGGNPEGRSFNVVAGSIITYYNPDRPEGDNEAADEWLVVVEITLPTDGLGISLSCQFDERLYMVGETVDLNWTVANLGPVALSKVEDDDNNRSIPYLPDTLGAGESYTWTESVTITREMYDQGLLFGITEDGVFYDGPGESDRTFALFGNIVTYYDPDSYEGTQWGDDCFVFVEIVPAVGAGGGEEMPPSPEQTAIPKIPTKNAVETSSGYKLSDGGLTLLVQVAPENIKAAYEEGETVVCRVYVINSGVAPLYRVAVENDANSPDHLWLLVLPGGDSHEFTNASTTHIQVRDTGDGNCRVVFSASGVMEPEYKESTGAIPSDAMWVRAEDVVLYLPIASKETEAAPVVDPLSLTVTAAQTSPEKAVYAPGDALDFTVEVENQTGVPLTGTDVNFTNDHHQVEPAKKIGDLDAEGKASLEYHYTVTETDAEKGEFTLAWTAYADLPEGVHAHSDDMPEGVWLDYVASKQAEIPLHAAPPAPEPEEEEAPDARIAALGDVKEDWQQSEYTEGQAIRVLFYGLNSGNVTFDIVYTYLDGALCSYGGPVEPSHFFGNGVDDANDFTHFIHDSGDGYDHLPIKVIGKYTDKDGNDLQVEDEVTLVLKVAPAAAEAEPQPETDDGPVFTFPDPDPVIVTHEPEKEAEGEPVIKLVAAAWTEEPLHFDGMGNTPEVQYTLTVSNVGEGPCTLHSILVTLPDGNDSIDLGGVTLLPGGTPVNQPYGHVYSEADVDAMDGLLHVAFQARGEGNGQPYDSTLQALTHKVTQKAEGWKIPDATAVRVSKVILSQPADPAGYHLGEEISYAVTVTNVSSIAIPSLAILDGLIGPGDLDTLTNLEPMESRTVSNGYRYTVAEQDVLNGQVYNVASAVWTDPVSGNTLSQASDPVVAYTAAEQKTAGVQVKIEYVEPPQNGAFYVENEQFHIRVSWENSAEETLYNVAVHDAQAEWISAAPGGYLLQGGTLLPGEGDSFVYLYTVDSIDVAIQAVDDAALITAVTAGGEERQNIAYESQPAGKEQAWAALALTKEETSVPANGEYYVEGETIAYRLTYTNVGAETLTDVRLYDVLNDSVTFSGFASSSTFQPGDSKTFPYKYTVTAADAQAGQVRNSAYALFTAPNKTGVPVYSNIVVSRTGEAPIDPDEPFGGVTPGLGDSCVLTLTGLGDGAAEYTLTLCADHAEAWERTRSNTMKDREDPSFARNGWNTVANLWKTELDELYQALMDASTGDARTAVAQERAAFYAYVNAQQALLTAQWPDQPHLAVKWAAELLMRQTCALCYAVHNAPEARPDSRFGHGYDRLSVSGDVALCQRLEEIASDGNVIVTSLLCAEHGKTQDIIEELMAGAYTPEAQAAAFTRAGRLYQGALDMDTTARYMAAGDDLRPLIAQGRIALDELMDKENDLLAFLYPDHPEIVSEVLSQHWRDALIDHCRTLPPAPAPEEAKEAPAAEEKADASPAGTWYMYEVQLGESRLDPAALGMGITVLLNEDGSARITTDQGGETEESEGGWALTENGVTVTLEGETADFAWAEGILSTDLGGAVGLFSQNAPEAFALPAVVPADSEAAFAGVWQVTGLLMDGAVVPASMLGMDHAFAIEAGRAVETSGQGDEAVATEYAAEFINGALTLRAPNPLYPAFGEEFTVITMQRCDNGQLTYTQEMFDELITFYLDRTAD